MPRRDDEVRTLLTHVATACAAIERFTIGKTFDDYDADDLLRSGVERQFTIIGEALRNALLLDPMLESRITDARKIVDFRNVLVHAYATVYDEAVWTIVREDLPTLARELGALLPPA